MDREDFALVDLASHESGVALLNDILGEFCHQFRNRLSIMKMAMHASRSDEPSATWKELERRYAAIERVMDRLQLLRGQSSGTPVRLPLCMLLEDRREPWRKWMEAEGRLLEFEPPSEVVSCVFDPTRLRQALDAVIEWRAENGAAGSPVRLRWWTEEGEIHLTIREPPGLDGQDRENPRGGSSLALALLARVMLAHRGSLEVADRDGFEARCRWPLSIRSAP